MLQEIDPHSSGGIGRAGRLILFVALASASIVFLWAIGTLVKLVVVSALLAYIFDPVVVFLESRGLSRLASTSLVFLAFLAAVAVSFMLLVPAVSGEINAIKAIITAGKANDLIEKSQVFVNEKLSALGAERLDLLELWHDFVVDQVNSLLGLALNAISLLSSWLLVPFITFLLLTDGRAFKRSFVSAVPNRYFEFTLNLLYKMDVLLGNYLRGVFLESVIIAVLATGVLQAMHVKYYIVLGIIIGITNIIPYFGPIAGALPAILIALLDTGNPYFTLYVTIGLIAIQLIDNTVLKPFLLARMVNVRPLTVLLVVLIGGHFFGVFGMLLSVPVAAIIKVGVTEFLGNFRKYFRSTAPTQPAGTDPAPATENPA